MKTGWLISTDVWLELLGQHFFRVQDDEAFLSGPA
jgi:hypothetical protein